MLKLEVLSAAIKRLDSFAVLFASFFSVTRKSVVIFLNFVLCSNLSISSSNYFKSSIGGGLLDDLNPYVSQRK